MDTPLIEIFVLCYNRMSILRTISSILNQSSPYYRLVVSNNSTNQIIYQKIKEAFPGVEVRNRGGIAQNEHFMCCIREASLDFFCLFHDDDEMDRQYVEEIHLAMLHFPYAQAYATNALIVDSIRNNSHISFKCTEKYRIIKSHECMLDKYFGKNSIGIAPFPTYVYRKQKKMEFPNLGKYSDVIFCASQVMYGPVIWVNELLVTYNLHGENDGLKESLHDRLKLLSWLKRRKDLSKSMLQDYRIMVYAAANKRIKVGHRKSIYIERILRLKRRLLILFGSRGCDDA